MLDSLKIILDRLYNNIIGKVKSIDFNNQQIAGLKNPERMHALASAPEYSTINKFALQVSLQLPPTTAESQRESDIGRLEDWGQKVLKRNIEDDETIEEYRDLILSADRKSTRLNSSH